MDEDIFGSIDLRSWAQQRVQERIPQLIEEHEERVNAATKCQSCHRGDQEEVLLLCDNCGLGFHTHCLRPPLPGVPEEDWFCPICIDYEDIDSDQEEPEVLDGEERPLGNIFVNAERSTCATCANEVGSVFVIATEGAAPSAGTVPTWPPAGKWYCQMCAIGPIEEVWNAQMAALQALKPDWNLPELPAEAGSEKDEEEEEEEEEV